MTLGQNSGQCRLCSEVIERNRMMRHLQKCVPYYFNAHPSSETEHPFYLIRVSGYYAPEYWLYLLVPTHQKLKALDRFLRNIWLECCGHLSAFIISDREFTSEPMDDIMGIPTRLMGRFEVGKVVKPKMKFYHHYDFGSTTELVLEVLAELQLRAANDRIHLVARNEPPVHNCPFCNAPAKWICPVCIYQGLEQALMCENCIARHQQTCEDKEFFDETCLLPVVNSPRMGVCGYTGGESEDTL